VSVTAGVHNPPSPIYSSSPFSFLPNVGLDRLIVKTKQSLAHHLGTFCVLGCGNDWVCPVVRLPHVFRLLDIRSFTGSTEETLQELRNCGEILMLKDQGQGHWDENVKIGW